MEVGSYRIVLNTFWLVIGVEIVAVTLWWILETLNEFQALGFILTWFMIVSVVLISFAYKRRRPAPQFDERLQGHYERSVMIAGLAGIVILLQITVVEIITGLNFRAFEILIAVGSVFFTTIAITNLILNKAG